MMGTLGATVQEITWISTGYIIANVVVMPFMAFLGRLFFGQKRVYMLCLRALLPRVALLCGTARSLPGSSSPTGCSRGSARGRSQPTEQAILRQTFPPKEQGMAMALFGMAVMLGPALGPTLGGYIVDNFAWPWIFYINVPVGILGLGMVAAFVHEDEEIVAHNRALAEAQRKDIDWWGIGLLIAGLCSLQYVLEEGQQDRTIGFESTTITIERFWAALAFNCGVHHPRAHVRRPRREHPPLQGPGVPVGDPHRLAHVRAPHGDDVPPAALHARAPRLHGDAGGVRAHAARPHHDDRDAARGEDLQHPSRRAWSSPLGVLFIAWGAYDMSHFTLESGQRDVIWAIMTQGIGFACLFVPLSTVALAAIPRHKMADATGLNSLFRQIGGSVGLAVGATLLTRYGAQARSSLVAHVTASNGATLGRVAQMTRGMMARGLDFETAQATALRALDGIVDQQATLLAFDRVFIMAGIAFLVVLPLLFFTEDSRSSPTRPRSTCTWSDGVSRSRARSRVRPRRAGLRLGRSSRAAPGSSRRS